MKLMLIAAILAPTVDASADPALSAQADALAIERSVNLDRRNTWQHPAVIAHRLSEAYDEVEGVDQDRLHRARRDAQPKTLIRQQPREADRRRFDLLDRNPFQMPAPATPSSLTARVLDAPLPVGDDSEGKGGDETGEAEAGAAQGQGLGLAFAKGSPFAGALGKDQPAPPPLATPLPPSLVLFGTGLSMMSLARRRRSPA